ncbi:hypothetical protein JCM18899A_19360 [Nocardioides sp. AN3]
MADVDFDVVVLVLEGQAKAGAKAGRDAHVRTVHAARDGDSAIVAEARAAADRGHTVAVVTADRALQANVSGFATTLSPTWLLEHL